MARLFLDSNVIIEGVFRAGTHSAVVLWQCSNRLNQAVITPYVVDEVELALLRKAERMPLSDAEALMAEYFRFVETARPEMIVLDENAPEIRQASIIHHLHDIPVLAAAIKAKPDWLLSRNRDHFTNDVAARTGLRIATPDEFLRQTMTL